MKLFWRVQIRKWDIDTLKKRLRAKLGGYGVAIKYLTTENTLYRGVVCAERPSTVAQISYPPAERVRKLGRLNREHQSIFYASRGAPAVFYEIRAKQGQRIVLSTWQVIEPLWIHNLGYHEESLRRIGARIEPGRGPLLSPIPNETEFNEKLRRQISLAFTDDVPEGEEYRYKLTIAINELLFEGADPLPTDIPAGPRSNRAAGTAYPAMKLRGAADNVAIRPEFVDRALRLVRLNYVLVEAADPDTDSYTICSLAQSDEFPGGEIAWRPGITDERRQRGTIAYENGTWVMRDGLNEIYDMH